MESLKLYWLGPHLVQWKGRPVKLETRKATALLAYLSLNPGDCQRELIATMFWPEGSQQKALANLRRTLSSLNASLPGWIEADREMISLKKNGRPWVDVQAFQDALSQLQENGHPDQEPGDDCLAILNEALQCYRGDFLEGLNLSDSPAFDEWQFFQRDGLRQGFAKVLECLSLAYSRRGQWDQAILFARRRVALDRLHEPACRTLMDLYARSGQRTAALRQYKDLADLLQEQMAQEPEPDTRQLYERILGPEDAPQVAAEREHPTSFPLLKTKLYIPAVPASRVVRSHLVMRLEEAAHSALTILSAPAGFGKTTLLAEWIAGTSLPVAWLSLDNGDNDPYRFLDYLVAALECIQEDVGREARQMMRSPQFVPPHLVLASLLNDLGRVVEPYVLVLDDYQFITEHAVHESLAYLLDHIPSNLHLVIASRADPPLQLGRLRAHARMLELRTLDLRFTPEEAAEFLNAVMRLGLSRDDIEALEARTEGWVVGLQMAALSLKGHQNASEFIQAFSGSHRYVLDYLMEEVLKRQPVHIQTFLLHTSILDKLSGALCDALMSEEWKQAGKSGQAVLEYLEQSNLFLIPLDDNKQWYRYHHLFADLLRSRLNQSFMDQLERLHHQASQWYETNDLPDEAIQHAFAAHDTEEAIRLVEDHAEDSLTTGSYAPVLGWIQRLPPKRVESQPWLCVWLAWGVLASGKLEGVAQLIQDARKGLGDGFRGQPKAISPENEGLLIEILTLEVTLASVQEDHSKTIELALRALERIPDAASRHHINVLYPLGNAYYITGELAKAEQAYRKVRRLSEQTGYLLRHILATHKLACIQQIMGNLQQSYDLYQELLCLVERTGKQEAFGMGYIYAGMGSLHYEWNHPEDAWQMMARSTRLNQMTGVPMILVDGYNSIARVLIARGDLNAAEELSEKTAQLIKEYPVLPETREMFESCKVRLWLAKGDTKSAASWSQERLCHGLEAPSFEREAGDIALSRVLITQGAFTEAGRLLRKLAGSARIGGRNGRLAEILLLQARVLQLQDKREQALRSLEESMKFGESGNYIRLYIDEGKWLEDLLRLELKRESLKEPMFLAYSHRLLDAFSRKTEALSTRMPT